jgi:hypothetical protein
MAISDNYDEEISTLLEMASKVLPDEAMQAIANLPQDKLKDVLERLLQSSEIEYRPLTAEDASLIEVSANYIPHDNGSHSS